MLAGNLPAHQFVLHILFHLYKILWLGKSHAIKQYTQHNLHHFKRCNSYEQKKIGKIYRQQQADTSGLLYATCKFLQQTSVLCIIRGQSHRHCTALGSRKIPSQTPPKGQGRPTCGSQTGAVGLSRQANHKTRRDSAKEMRENVKSGVKCVTSWAWSQFPCFSTRMPLLQVYSSFVHNWFSYNQAECGKETPSS